MEKTYQFLKLLIWILSFALLFTGAYVLYTRLSADYLPSDIPVSDSPSGSDAPSTAAPDFTVYDLDGTPHKLSDYQGKPVILNFWASWCGPCKSEMPEFQQAYETYGQDIHFLLVNLTDGYQETVDSASSFLEGSGYTFPVYYDTDMSAAYAYAVNAVPVTYFIDPEGNLLANASGALSASRLQQGIDLLLK